MVGYLTRGKKALIFEDWAKNKKKQSKTDVSVFVFEELTNARK